MDNSKPILAMIGIVVLMAVILGGADKLLKYYKNDQAVIDEFAIRYTVESTSVCMDGTCLIKAYRQHFPTREFKLHGMAAKGTVVYMRCKKYKDKPDECENELFFEPD